MSDDASTHPAQLADEIVSRVDEILRASIEKNQPLEVDPARERLFELFVTADGAGYLAETGDADLRAESLCRQLATRWGLDSVAQDSVARQERIPVENVSQMRALWAFLRMWMEWTYAWERWREFHDGK
jgi:hypothetical protein